MIQITLQGNVVRFPSPLSLKKALLSLAPETASGIMACFHKGSVLELNTVLDRSGELTPITYQDEEGRRIYERSLRFVFLLAVQRCFPSANARMEHSIGQGI